MRSQRSGGGILSFATNGWEVLLSHLGIANPTDKAKWKSALACPSLGYRYLTQILTLAYWDAQSERPCDLQGIRSLCAELGVNYHAFTTGHKNELRNELAMLGDERVRLIESGGKAFYLRTIARLSGSRYVQFARSLKSVLAHVSIAEMEDENRFIELLRTYGTVDVKQILDSEKDEERESNDEALSFLWKMLKIFQRTGRAPTIEDIHEVASVSKPICKRIAEELTSAVKVDPMPELAFTEDGQAVFLMPKCPEFDGNPETVIFRFFKESPVTGRPICRCNYVDHSWNSSPSPSYAVTGVPAEEIKSVQKRTIRAGIPSEFWELVGSLSSDGDGRFALVHVVPDDRMACGYRAAPGRNFVRRADRLRLGEYYRIVFLGDSHLSVRVNTVEHEDGFTLPMEAFATAHGKSFRIPFDALSLKVGDVEFAVENGVTQWLPSGRDRITCIENKGCRIFVNATTFPLSRFAVLPPDIVVSYEYDGVCEQLFSKGCSLPLEWRAPSQIIWKKGRLSILSADEKKVWRYPMTFVDVDFSELNLHVFDEGEASQVNVRLGEKNLTLDFSGDDVELGGLAYGGFTFRPKIRREGVMLHVAGKDIVIPRDTGIEPKLHVALKDFDQGDKARNVTITSEQSDSFEFVQGSRCTNVGEDPTYVVCGAVSGSSLLGNPLEFPPNEFNRCRFELNRANGGVDPYPFRLYDPKATPMPSSAIGKPFLVEHDNANPSDLLVSYFTSYADYYSDRERVLACYPAHRQDDLPILIPVDNRSCKTDKLGRLIETITVKGFYDRDVPHGWGWGMICFSAMKMFGGGDDAHYEALSAGFFVARPDGKSPQIDDAYGLRTALAATSVRNAYGKATDEQRECLKRIEDIMSSESPEVRAAIRAYIPRAIEAADKVNVFGSLNSFRNGTTDSNGNLVWVSGYLFMAGWYLKEKLAENEGELPAYLRPYWHRALIGYADAEKAVSKAEQSWFECIKPKIEGLVEKFLNDLNDDYISWWRQENVNEAGLPPSLSTPTLLGIERFVNRYVCDGLGQQVPECRFKTMAEHGHEDVHRFTYQRFRALVRLTAKWLHRWRKQPSLYERLGHDAEGRAISVQELREILLFFDSIDQELSQSATSQEELWRIVESHPMLFLVEGISLAYKLKEESEQLNKGENK